MPLSKAASHMCDLRMWEASRLQWSSFQPTLHSNQPYASVQSVMWTEISRANVQVLRSFWSLPQAFALQKRLASFDHHTPSRCR